MKNKKKWLPSIGTSLVLMVLFSLILLYSAELLFPPVTLAQQQIQQQSKSQPFQVKSANPSKLTIQAGGKEVPVTVMGANLGQITSIFLLLGNQPVKDVTALLGPPGATSRKVTLKAGTAAKMGIYQFRVVAAQQTIDLPLQMISLEVVKAQSLPSAGQQLPQAVTAKDTRPPTPIPAAPQQAPPQKPGGLKPGQVASAPQGGRDMPNPQAGNLQQVLPGAQPKDLGSTRPQTTATGPVQQPGSLRPDLAAFERAIRDALWRLTTGCAAPANGQMYTAQEAAACAARPANDRLATAQQARSDLATAIGQYGGLSLEQSAALLRGIPAPRRSSTGAILFPTKDEIQSYLSSKQREAQYDVGHGSGTTKQEAERRITILGKAIEIIGKAFRKDVLKATGKEIQGAAPGLSEAGEKHQKGSTIGQRGGILGEVMKDVDDTSARTQDKDSKPIPYSAEQCRQICENSKSPASDRKKCGCYDYSQGVKQPAGPSGSGGKGQVSDVKPLEVIKEGVQPVINPVPDDGSQGLPPRPKPRPEGSTPDGK